MNNEYLRYIIRDALISKLTEEAIQTSPFTPAEEKFLARFAELGAQSLGIIYAPNEIGIREFLGRSGKDFNLSPDILAKLLKDKIISIVPYGGYSRNQDYTIRCNLPIEELEGMSSGEEEKGSEEDTGGEVAAGPPEESAGSSMDLSKLLVAEQKKSKKHTRSRIHTRKSRTLGRLPKGYVVYLERIIQILGKKLHSKLEKEHLVADILDNLAHNFGLTPTEVYKSFIFYKSQNRLQNVVKEYLENDKDMIKLKELLKEQQTETKTLPAIEFNGVFDNNYITPKPGTWEKYVKQVVDQINSYILPTDKGGKGYQLTDIQIAIHGGASPDPASNIYKGTSPPKHDFGGLLKKYSNGWVKPGIPGGMNIEPDTQTKKGGTEGNKFLALARAKKLQSLLIPEIEKQIGQKLPDIFKLTDTPGTERFVHAIITPTVKKKPVVKTYPYAIQYPWYEIGKSGKLVLADTSNNWSGWRNNKAGTMSSKWNRIVMADQQIPYAGFQKAVGASGGLLAAAFVQINPDKYDKAMAYYNNYEAWWKDVQKMIKYASGLQVGLMRDGDPNSKDKVKGTRGADGYLDRTGKSNYTGLAKFGMRTQDPIVSNTKPLYLFKPQTEAPRYMVDLFPVTNKFTAPATGARGSDGKRSNIIGKKYDVQLSPDTALTYSGKEDTIKTYYGTNS